MKKLVTAEIQLLLPRIGIILVTIIFVIISSNIILNKISESQSNADNAKQEEADLGKKFNSLSSLQKSTLPTGSASLALTNENSSLLALSQLKKIASENSLAFTDVEIGQESSGSGVFHTDITLDISAPFTQITSFVKKIAEVAPIMRVKSIKLLSTKDVAQTTLVISTFWAPFPTQLPPVTKELQQPTTEENQILTKLGNLLTPPVGGNLTPQTTPGRSDPFSFQ